jgi:hypothetical protein
MAKRQRGGQLRGNNRQLDQIDASGLGNWLTRPGEELRAKTYKNDMALVMWQVDKIFR